MEIKTTASDVIEKPQATLNGRKLVTFLIVQTVLFLAFAVYAAVKINRLEYATRDVTEMALLHGVKIWDTMKDVEQLMENAKPKQKLLMESTCQTKPRMTKRAVDNSLSQRERGPFQRASRLNGLDPSSSPSVAKIVSQACERLRT